MTGAKVPVDGKVVDGNGYANEAHNRESKPVNKDLGKMFMQVQFWKWYYSNRSGKVGEDTTFGKIIELVEEAQIPNLVQNVLLINLQNITPLVLVMAL